MKEIMEKALGKIILQVTEGVDVAIGFLSKEIPDVVRQLLAWYFVYNLISFLAAVVTFIVIGICLKIVLRKIKAHYPNGGEDYWCGLILAVFVAFFVSIPGFIWINIGWLKIWIAPKIWLIEYVTEIATK